MLIDKNQNNKYSIEKINEIWVQSQSNIDLIGLSDAPNQSHHHFASPGYTNFGFNINMKKNLEVLTLPIDLNPKVESVDKLDIIKQEFSLGVSSCDFISTEYKKI